MKPLLLCLLAFQLYAAPYKIAPGELPPKPPSEDFTLLTFNTLFIPFPVSYFTDGMTPWPDRIDAIAEILIAQDADILCLQEVFSNLSARALIKRLSPRYHTFYYDISPRFLTLNSGLFVASKFPLKNTQFHPYNSMDRGVAKGAFFFDTEFGHFVNTHLSAPKAHSHHKRLEQLNQLLSWAPESTLIAGDLNIAYGSRTYLQSKLPSLYNPNPSSDPTYTYAYSPENVTGSTIYDYILFSGTPRPQIDISLVPFFDPLNHSLPLSDHQALIAHVQLLK